MATAALVVVAVVASALAGSDLVRRRLPNAGVATFAASVSVLLVSGPANGGLEPPAALALGVAAGVVGVGVWAAGLMAAGDAKVVAPVVALEAWMGSGPLLVYLGLTIVGTVLGLGWLVTHRSLASEPPAAAGSGRASVPLGTILLAGVAPSALVLGLGR